MCGIDGFCSFKENFLMDEEKNINTLIKMRKAIAHRGKDQTGEYLREHIGLSHTRLSIRDVSMGAQPIIRKNADYEYAIVYNGEIYNTEELTHTLKRFGYEFKTTTDTEVILYAYMKFGVDCVKYLNGIFAFAIWDGRKNKLFLFRDRVGIKPLFFTVKDDLLVFGSEIKALFANDTVKPEVDINSFREIFGIGPARSSGCGIFKDIKEIKPGHLACFDENGIVYEQYWDLESREHIDSYEKTLETVSYLVKDSITRQMISDVPVCSLLSGGLDSSIVTAVASKVMLEQGSKLNTFSFDFTGNDKYFTSNSFQPERDKPYVDKMLKYVDVNHTYLECDEQSLADMLYYSVCSKDLPGMADVDASLLYFCKLVKQSNKVTLTGECADEIFGGYPWFYREDLLMSDSFPWSRNIDVRTSLLNKNMINKLDLKNYIENQYKNSVAKVPKLDGESETEAMRRKIGYLNIKWFMQTLLDRMDRASMATGLEARVPFADHRIIEYVFNVPWKMKYQNGVEKALLREACNDILPKELLYRKKSPYPKTYNPNYELRLKKMMNDILADKNSPIYLFIDEKKMRDFLTIPAQCSKPWFGQLMAGPQLIAYMIQINQWLEQYNPKIII